MVSKIEIYTQRCGFVSQANIDSQVSTLQEFVTFYDHDIASPQTHVKLSYDEQRLYIQIDAFRPDPTEVLHGDGFEILLKPGQGTSDYLSILWMNKAAKKPYKSDLGPHVIPFTSFEAETFEDEDFWSVTFSIRFTDLNVERVSPGDAWEFNVLRYLVGARPASSWVPIRHSYFSDHESGYHLKATVTEEGRTGSIVFGNQVKPIWIGNAELKFVSFKQKQIKLKNISNETTKLSLKWKDPSGHITFVETTLVSNEDASTTLDFCHPEPLINGWYEIEIEIEIEIIALDQNQQSQSYCIAFDRISLIRAGRQLFHPPSKDSGEKDVLLHLPPSEEVQQLLNLIPEQPGFTFTGLPDQPDLWPYQLWEWDCSKPDHLSSKKSTRQFPNLEYEETHSLSVINPKGQTCDYPYYEDAEGKKYFVTAHLWKRQNEYVLHQTELLAERDPLGAARIIYRYAQLYEGYVPVYDYPWINYPMRRDAGPPYPYWGGMWSRWFYMDLYVLSHLSIAFEKVMRTNAFRLLSEEEGRDVAGLIIDRMFKPSADFVESYPNMNTNMDFARWLGLVYLGKAINEPDYIHEVLEILEDFVGKQFLFDGSWREVTLSYHKQTVQGLQKVAAALKDWSDPPGYVSPRSGQRLDQLDLEQRIPEFKKSNDLLKQMTYPDGRFLPVMDTWGYDRMEDSDPRPCSLLMPAAGIARLAIGHGEEQTQVYLSFVPKYGHNHLDPLHLTLYANKQELLPDIGYTHTRYRYSTVCTFGHNTVLVDGMDMVLDEGNVHGGNIQLFAPSQGSLQIMGASYAGAYPQVNQYEREVWLVPFPEAGEEQGYIVDLFRVSGGNKHEYILHGDPNRDAEWLTDITLETNEGLIPNHIKVAYPTMEDEKGHAEGYYSGYIFMKDVKRALLPDGQCQLTLTTGESNQQASQLKILHDVEAGENELLLGTWPSLRATRVERQDTNDQAEKYVLPKMVLRREGKDLKSVFVTLMEPHELGHSRVENMEVIQRTGAFAAVKVTSGNITDILLSHADESPAPVTVGDIRFNGKKAFIRLVEHRVKQMMLVGGTLLQKGELLIAGSGTIKGKIRQVLSKAKGDDCNAFVTETDIGAEAPYTYITIAHPDGKSHGYPLTGVLRDERGTIILIGDQEPGFAIEADGTSHRTAFPQTRWKGEHCFTLDSIVDVTFF